MHFLSEDCHGGGHVVDFMLEKGTVSLQVLSDYRIILPLQEDFNHANLGGDTSAAITRRINRFWADTPPKTY